MAPHATKTDMNPTTERPGTEFRLQTPVVFMVFNRPDVTRQVFAEIRRARPPKLLVIADGARPDKAGEAARVDEVRAIIDGVDWDCEVLRNFAPTNLGCKKRISSGLDWVFREVEEAIILEDDCLPHPSFFRYSQELLERYRQDTRVMSISGDNFQGGWRRSEFSYYFSQNPHIWGWATWRRAWQLYDVDMKFWPLIRRGDWMHDLFHGRRTGFWTSVFQNTCEGLINTWDFQWAFACRIHSGLSILPAVNLVRNIGFGVEGTHTGISSSHQALEPQSMEFPLRHPPFMVHDLVADERTAKFFSWGGFRFILQRLKRMMLFLRGWR